MRSVYPEPADRDHHPSGWRTSNASSGPRNHFARQGGGLEFLTDQVWWAEVGKRPPVVLVSSEERRRQDMREAYSRFVEICRSTQTRWRCRDFFSTTDEVRVRVFQGRCRLPSTRSVGTRSTLNENDTTLRAGSVEGAHSTPVRFHSRSSLAVPSSIARWKRRSSPSTSSACPSHSV